jgi:peptidoglycan/LPS O-acetylase OafA/YrhL
VDLPFGILSGMGEQDATGYARLYAPLAAVSLVISFQPILPPEYGTLWDMAARPGGGPALIGVALMLGMIALLAYASFRPVRSKGVPTAIAVLAALIVVMLLTKPGTAKPTPSLTSFGDAALAVACCAFALALSHAVRARKR